MAKPELVMLEKLASSDQPIQRAWQEAVPAHQRAKLGKTIQKYVRRRLSYRKPWSLLSNRSGCTSKKIAREKSIDLTSFFLDQKTPGDYYFEE